jgi:hypothetical protein
VAEELQLKPNIKSMPYQHDAQGPSIHPLSTTGAATGSVHSEEPELKGESDVKPDVKPDSKPLCRDRWNTTADINLIPDADMS